MPLPYQGRPGVLDYASPTLLPNFNRGFMSTNGTLDYKSPAQVAQENARADATATATVGGTATAGDTVTLTVTQAQLPNGKISGTYTVATGDSSAAIAAGLASAFNDAADAAGVGTVRADASEAVITVHWDGPMGNFAVLSGSKSTGATETITIAPAGGAMSGGSGPVFCANNFNFTYNGCTMSFFYGEPYFLGSDLLAVFAQQDMPVV